MCSSDLFPSHDTTENTLYENNYYANLSTTEKSSFGGKYYYDPDNSSSYSYMPAMTGYMKNKDLLSSTTGTQTVSTYTIGFGSDTTSTAAVNLLTETATRGGGSFYSATDATGLASALNSILVNINQQQNSMVSVATTGSASDKTQYLDLS